MSTQRDPPPRQVICHSVYGKTTLNFTPLVGLFDSRRWAKSQSLQILQQMAPISRVRGCRPSTQSLKSLANKSINSPLILRSMSRGRARFLGHWRRVKRLSFAQIFTLLDMRHEIARSDGERLEEHVTIPFCVLKPLNTSRLRGLFTVNRFTR